MPVVNSPLVPIVAVAALGLIVLICRWVFSTDYRLIDGNFQLGERPGLGVTLDQQAAKRHPYRPAYLPVNRLLDGTMHDW